MAHSRFIGVSVIRREDYRLLTGTGQFVGDIQLPNMLEAALVRSPYPHGIIRSIDLADARATPGVELALDGATVGQALDPLDTRQITPPPGWSSRVEHRFDQPAQPILGNDRVTYVGEPIGVIVARDGDTARTVAESVGMSIDPIEAVVDPRAALEERAPVIHPDIGRNVIATMHVGKGDCEGTLSSAPYRLQRCISHHRYAAMPMECRAAIADFDQRTGTLTLWSTSQVVFWVRTQIARALNLAEEQVRVVAPDVGGGFGVKGHVYPEEILIAYLAMQLKRPVRWIERRTEHFLASTHARDHLHHDVDFAFDEHGRLLALRDHALVDTGAYCPIGAGVNYNTAAHMLGPYNIEHFESSMTIVCTNKAPNAPYRGAGRPEAVQVMERVLEVVAATLDLDPVEVRLRNMIRPEQMPFSVGLPYRDGEPIVYDSGDYPRALRTAVEALGGIEAFRREQSLARRQGRFIGLGVGCYTEGTGVGPFEGARVRLDRSGKLIVSVGACPQGQGHETVYAQVAAQSWQMPIDDVVVEVGDTGKLAMGYGTVASRSAITASMAVEGASAPIKDKVLAIASELLEASTVDLELRDGGVSVKGAPGLRVSLGDIASAALPGWQHRRPPGMGAGLEASDYYEPQTVTWSYAAIAATVEIDPETGVVTVSRYVEVHDAGVLLNPTLADGQVMGGVAQGIGGALWESMVYDEEGQLLSGSFMDYAMPRASDMPPITIIHHESPSPLNPLGIKGLGEGGAIAPPVVIANALGDALREFDCEFNALPIRPEAVLAAMGDVRLGTSG
ncbi:MAG: xanthine dehydrogenase family protein molybdopterin-binding subunit [Pseudomonadota bacterium]